MKNLFPIFLLLALPCLAQQMDIVRIPHGSNAASYFGGGLSVGIPNNSSFSPVGNLWFATNGSGLTISAAGGGSGNNPVTLTFGQATPDLTPYAPLAGTNLWTGNQMVSNSSPRYTVMSSSKQDSIYSYATNNQSGVAAYLSDLFTPGQWLDSRSYVVLADQTNSAGQIVDNSGNSVVISNVASTVVSLGPNPFGRNESYRNYVNAGGTASQYQIITNTVGMTNSGPFTVFSWVKLQYPSGVTYSFFMSKRPGAGTTMDWQFIFDNTGKLQLYVDGQSGNYGEYLLDGAAVAQPTNVWVFCTGVYTGGTAATSVQIYTNGVRLAGDTQTKSGAFSSRKISTSSISLGCGAYDTFVNPFNGDMDFTGYYNDALTASQVSTLYSNVGGSAGPIGNIRVTSAFGSTNTWNAINIDKVTVAGDGAAPIQTYGDIRCPSVLDGSSTRHNVAGVEQYRDDSAVTYPTTDNFTSLGDSSHRFLKGWFYSLDLTGGYLGLTGPLNAYNPSDVLWDLAVQDRLFSITANNSFFGSEAVQTFSANNGVVMGAISGKFWGSGNYNDGRLGFATTSSSNLTVKMVITGAGYVGILNSVPSTPLDVGGNVTVRGATIFAAQSNVVTAVLGGIYFNTTNNTFYKCTNGTSWTAF